MTFNPSAIMQSQPQCASYTSARLRSYQLWHIYRSEIAQKLHPTNDQGRGQERKILDQSNAPRKDALHLKIDSFKSCGFVCGEPFIKEANNRKLLFNPSVVLNSY